MLQFKCTVFKGIKIINKMKQLFPHMKMINIKYLDYTIKQLENTAFSEDIFKNTNSDNFLYITLRNNTVILDSKLLETVKINYMSIMFEKI